MSTDIKTVVIVGGVAGGASTAAKLRRQNEKYEIEIVLFLSFILISIVFPPQCPHHHD